MLGTRGGDAGRRVDRLIEIVQRLSLTRELTEIMEIVRTGARELTGADGATFVLRDGDRCFYADEDAIEPLWKGKRFPINACISGWSMQNRTAATIEDIYADPRIPHDAYRPTFVKSLVMVPIRTKAPIGAIGNYWAHNHKATDDELRLLQALADSTSIAIENVELYRDLENRVAERTAELEFANAELQAFAGRVSHDLRAPLRSQGAFGRIVLEDFGAQLDPRARKYIERMQASAERMGRMVENLLGLARVDRGEVRREPVDVTELARDVLAELAEREPQRSVHVEVEEGMRAEADAGLLRIVLENLLGNAWKFSARIEDARIDVRMTREDGRDVFCVRDNGAGFEPSHASRVFEPFTRLHSEREFAGTGIGLATVERIVRRHGGTIWAESAVGRGATFLFTLR